MNLLKTHCRRALVVIPAVALLIAYGEIAGATPLRLDYAVTDLGGGIYDYDFTLVLDNNDASWAANQGFGWVIFGDCSPSCSSPLTGFVGASVDLPWTGFSGTGGGHNGPTLSPVTAYFVPTFVGDFRTWSGTSTVNLPQGSLLWSNLLQQNGAVLANVAVANRVECGDGDVDDGEQCDDGNLVNGDCCDESCLFEGNGDPCSDGDVCTTIDTCDGAGTCIGSAIDDCDDGNACTQDSCDGGCVNASTPATTCLVGTKTSLQVLDNEDDTKDQIKWKWGGGPAVAQAGLGAPTGGTTYTLCIYDSTTGTDALVTKLQVDPNAFWLNKDPKGWSYKDSTGSEDGVIKASLKTGDAGKAKAQVGAKGINVPTMVPYSETELFDIDPRVTVQLFNDAVPTPMCWTSSFTAATVNSETKYKAKLP